MANPEHLEILKQGVKVWNHWRASHPEIIRPDLAGAKLSALDLEEVNLVGATLIEASFFSSTLMNTNLRDSTLMKATFIYAHLMGTNLRGADLRGAGFAKARLSGVDLSMADLTYADFTDAEMSECTFGSNDLSLVRGLDTVQHYSPSIIGIDVLYQSKGNIPESFLRRAGVPNNFITYISALAGDSQPMPFYSCFISYSSKEQAFAEQLYIDLRSNGVRCWFAPEDLKIGDKIRDSIDESIRLRDKLLLILSEHSIASDWVEHEVEGALEEERQRGRTILFPIRLDDAVMENNKAWAALIRRTRHIGDFTRWKEHDSYQKAFDRLLRDLKAEEKKDNK
jgi:hypothetical protein